MSWLAPATGILFIGISLSDIFLTVIYARSGAGFLAPRINRGAWGIFRAAFRSSGRKPVTLLCLAGPLLLVVMAAVWLLLLVLGFALVYWPGLGTALQAGSGATSTDFLTAVYYSGFSFTTLGLGDIEPKVETVRMMTVIEAALGFAFFTLTITYFLSVFSALHRRNTFASTIHQKTSGTGASSTLACSLGSKRDFTDTSRQLGELAAGCAELLESHHFYPVLHYFHFRQTRYGIPRMLTVLLDTTSLLKSLPLKQAGEIESDISQLETACRDILDQLAENFLGRSFPEKREEPAEVLSSWRRQYRETLRDLTERGADLSSEDREGEDAYIENRKSWHAEIVALCDDTAFEVGEIMES